MIGLNRLLSRDWKKRYRTLLAFACLLFLAPSQAAAQPPRIFYTDLISGPATGGQNNNGAFITLYGERFGSAQGSGSVTAGGAAVAGYPIWTDTKVTIQLGASAATGNLVLTNADGASNGIAFTVASGNIYFVAPTGSDGGPGTYSSPWLTLTYARDTIAPGDIVYAMNGVAQTTDDGQGWSSCLTIGANSGSPGALKAMVVYPGASATIGNVNSTADGGCDTAIRAKGQGESYWAFAGFTIRGGSITLNPYSETGWRIVANDLSCPNGNAQAGCLDLAYEVSLAVYGNYIHHVGTNLNPGDVTALYHGVYISEFNHGVDFGWNTIAYVQGCRGLQQNVNEGSSSYDLHIHDNIIHDTQCDGIVMTTVDPSMGTVELYNNIVYNAGTGPANAEPSGAWNCLFIYGGDPANYGPGSGTVEVYNNTMYDCGTWTDPTYTDSEGMLLWESQGTNKSMRIRNNIIYAGTVSPYCADIVCDGITGSNNIFYGNGPPPANSNLTNSINADPLFINPSLTSPNFHLQSGSPAIDAGVTIPGLATDFAGIARPQGSAFDIGAYQYVAAEATPALSARPASLAFGNVLVNQNSTLTTVVTNTGTANVTISAASITGVGFSIVSQPSYPVTLAPAASAQYTVKFAPTATGTVTGQLTVASVTIPLSATGFALTAALSASPTSLAFGNVPVNQSSTLTTTITNTGAATITLNAASITGTGFTIVSQPSYPDVLPPNATAQYTVKFAPTATGTASGTLTVASIAISLSGTSGPTTPIAVGKKGSNGTGSSGDGSPILVTWNGGGSTTGSSAILVMVYAVTGPYFASNISDSAGDIYHLDAAIAHPHSGVVYVFSCLHAASVTSVTVAPPTFGDFQIVALEYRGLVTTAGPVLLTRRPRPTTVDQVGTMNDAGFQSAGGTYNWTTNSSGTLGQAPELVLAINAEPYGDVTGYSANGYTQEVLESTPSGSIAVLDAVVSSTSSVTPAGLYTASAGTWVGSFVMTYK